MHKDPSARILIKLLRKLDHATRHDVLARLMDGDDGCDLCKPENIGLWQELGKGWELLREEYCGELGCPIGA